MSQDTPAQDPASVAAVRRIFFPSRTGRLNNERVQIVHEGHGMLQCAARMATLFESKVLEVGELQATVSQLTERVTTLEEECSEWEADAEEADAERAVAVGELATLREDFTAANTSLCNTTTQLQEVKSELAKFKPQIAFVDSMSADDMRGVLLQLQQAQGIYLQRLTEQRTPEPVAPVAAPCVVCKDVDHKVLSTLQCGHVFCVGCANRLYEEHPTCPKCRQAIHQAPTRLWL